MVYIFIILCFIAVLAIGALMISLNNRNRETAIAIIENGKVVDGEVAQIFIDNFPIHWYVFEEMTEEEKLKEIKDLKEHYKLVLEAK